MTCEDKETVYLGTDNTISRVLLEDDVAVADLSGVTRVTVEIGKDTIDSDVVGSSVIWWTDTDTFNGATVDVIKFRLGGQSLSPITHQNCKIKVYDASHTNGQVWESALAIEVKS